MWRHRLLAFGGAKLSHEETNFHLVLVLTGTPPILLGIFFGASILQET